jgi:hypothetical protein
VGFDVSRQDHVNDLLSKSQVLRPAHDGKDLASRALKYGKGDSAVKIFHDADVVVSYRQRMKTISEVCVGEAKVPHVMGQSCNC